MTQPSHSPGRGLVIAGAILVLIYLLPAVAMIIWFLMGLMTSQQAASMVFPFWLVSLLGLAPLWIGGMALLGAGRTRQRGPVKGSVVAWILAIGAMPLIGLLLAMTVLLLGSGQDSLGGGSFAILIIGIPLLTVLAFASGAWLTWGRPVAR